MDCQASAVAFWRDSGQPFDAGSGSLGALVAQLISPGLLAIVRVRLSAYHFFVQNGVLKHNCVAHRGAGVCSHIKIVESLSVCALTHSLFFGSRKMKSLAFIFRAR